MYEDVEPVDLDAVDDDRDVDTDAASAEPLAPSGELPGAGDPPRCEVTIPRSAATGAAIGAGAYAGASVVRRHKVLATTAAVGVGIAMLPPAARKVALIIVAALAGLVVALIGVMLWMGVSAPAPQPTSPVSTPVQPTQCIWGSAICSGN